MAMKGEVNFYIKSAALEPTSIDLSFAAHENCLVFK